MQLDGAILTYEGSWGSGAANLPLVQRFIDELPIKVTGYRGRVPELKISPNSENNRQVFMEIPRGTALLELERAHAKGYEVRIIYDNAQGLELQIHKGLLLIVNSK